MVFSCNKCFYRFNTYTKKKSECLHTRFKLTTDILKLTMITYNQFSKIELKLTDK